MKRRKEEKEGKGGKGKEGKEPNNGKCKHSRKRMKLTEKVKNDFCEFPQNWKNYLGDFTRNEISDF